MGEYRKLGSEVPDIGSENKPVLSPYGLPAYRKDGFWYYRGYSMSGSGKLDNWMRVTDPRSQELYDKSYKPDSKEYDTSTLLINAYIDWQDNMAYLDSRGNYRLKVEDKPIAPWSGLVKKMYSDNEDFHNAGKSYKGRSSLLRYLENKNQERDRLSRNRDENSSHNVTISHTDEKVKRWLRNPGSMDVIGIDTPSRSRKRTVKKSRRQDKPATLKGIRR